MTRRVNKKKIIPEPSSFRDPSGYLIHKSDQIYRVINKNYANSYEKLISSGLYKSLTNKNYLIAHKKYKNVVSNKEIYKTVKPTKIDYISYPYEWCFDQYKQAALLTLKIQIESLEHNMILKDASAYNIQFVDNQPIFIDTLSFEPFEKGYPWVAYRQFTKHFLAPLLLLKYKGHNTASALLKENIDGIPLEITSSLLPKHTCFNFQTLLHIHLNTFSKKMSSKKSDIYKKNNVFTKKYHTSLAENLISHIEKVNYKKNTQWRDYNSFTNYSPEAKKYKEEFTKKTINKLKPKFILDIGANTGKFTKSKQKNTFVVSIDKDQGAVNKNFKKANKKSFKNYIPLVIDIANPSPAIGWANLERKSFLERTNPDLIIALALVHHLYISDNLPFSAIAELFSRKAKHLLIEFVPKSDSKFKQISQSKNKEVINIYNIKNFEKSFKKYFKIVEKKKITDSKRYLYLMKSK